MAQIVALDRKEPILFQWQDDFVVGVMLASKGYPVKQQFEPLNHFPNDLIRLELQDHQSAR
jgi:phosphoribosylamine-glycine ligase